MKSALCSALLATATLSIFAASAFATDPDTDYRLRQLEQRTSYLERRVEQLEHHGPGPGPQHRYLCTVTTHIRSYEGMGWSTDEASRIAEDTCMRYENNQYSCYRDAHLVCRMEN